MKKLLLITFITASTMLNATITVTNVNLTKFTSPASSYLLDLDNDATPDFSIDAYKVVDTNQIQLKMLHVNAETVPLMAATVNVVDAKNLGDNFGNWWQSYDSYIFQIPEFMTMNGAGNKYIGLRLFKNGNYYYGWVQVNVYTNADFVTVINYGFEDIPNTKITAGQTVSSPSSINELNKELFTIYPNPVNNSFTINTISKSNITSIRLYSLMGELVKEIGTSAKLVNTSDLKAGIYFIEIIADNRKTIKKIVKN
jgi:hypothetical protein